jgi:hypothetical protein
MYYVDEATIRVSIKYLKKDINDDWYCDPQNYKDVFTDVTKLTNKINQKIKAGKGIYVAEKSAIFNIPKGNGGFRYTLEQSPIDRLAYHIFGIKLIHYLDRTLPFNILSHRKSLDEDTLYKPYIEQWSKFENFTRICGKDKYIVETDITNYYDNIDIGILKNELINTASEAKLSPEEFIECMFFIESINNILLAISFNGKKGLPQNRDISSFLANIYMKPIDKCLTGITYFRYMDDIRVITDTRPDANRYMLKMVESLRNIGLALNSSKTRILEPKSSIHKEYCEEIDLESRKIDAMINSGKRKYVLESFHEVFKKVIEYLEEGKINERKFRFYANRLIIFLNAKDVTVPRRYKKLLAEKLIGGINVRPDCADQICSLAQAIGSYSSLQEDLSKWVIDEDNLTFEWSVYLVLKTLISQGYSNSDLNKYCNEQLCSDSSSIAIRGVSAIYRNTKSKKEIVEMLSKEESFFLRRHYIVALAKCSQYKIKKMRSGEKINNEILEEHGLLYRQSNEQDFMYIRRSEKQFQRILIKELNGYA